MNKAMTLAIRRNMPLRTAATAAMPPSIDRLSPISPQWFQVIDGKLMEQVDLSEGELIHPQSFSWFR